MRAQTQLSKNTLYWALFSPIWLPMLSMFVTALLTGSHLGVMTVEKANELGVLAGPLKILTQINLLFFLGLVFGGLQYVVFMGFMIYHYHGRDTAWWSRRSWYFPLLFLPVFEVGFLMFKGLDRGVLLLGLLAIPYGYFYVIFGHVFARFVSRRGKKKKRRKGRLF